MKQPAFWILSMMSLAAASDECQECQGDLPQSKAGVVMLVKGNFATSATAGASVDSDQGMESEVALISSFMKLRGSEFSDSMVKQLASMRITPEVRQFIKGTLLSLDPVFTELVNSTQNDIIVCRGMFDSFATLDQGVEESNAAISDAEAAANNSRVAHQNCRNVQLEHWKKWQVCRSEENALSADEAAAKGTLQDATTHFKNLLCHDKNITNNLQAKIDAAGPFKTAGEAYLKAKALYDAKVEECNRNETRWTKKKDDCDHAQETFERLMCDCDNKISVSCATYRAKYNTKKTDYIIFQNQVVNNTIERKFEYTHLKRVACALSTLANHTIDNHAVLGPEIQACSQKNFPHPGFDFDPTDPPVPRPCKDGPPIPCEDRFKIKEYGHLVDGQKAATCRACT